MSANARDFALSTQANACSVRGRLGRSLEREPDQALVHLLLVLDEGDPQLLAVEAGAQRAEDLARGAIAVERGGQIAARFRDLALDERRAVKEVRAFESLQSRARRLRPSAGQVVGAQRERGAREQELRQRSARRLARAIEPVARSLRFQARLLGPLRLEQHDGAVEIHQGAPGVVALGVEAAARRFELGRRAVEVATLAGGDRREACSPSTPRSAAAETRRRRGRKRRARRPRR